MRVPVMVGKFCFIYNHLIFNSLCKLRMDGTGIDMTLQIRQIFFMSPNHIMKSRPKPGIQPFTLLVVILSFVTIVAFICRVQFR
jgi:hypothetical protein